MNPHLPRVGVLMATFNGAPWLREQIESILNQEDVSVRLIIADDGSTDNTIDLISEIKKKDDRVELIDFDSRAGSASANFFRLMMAVDVTTVDYIAFADQDDIWLPGKLRKAVSCLMNEKYVAYSCATTAFWPDGREKVMSQNSRLRSFDFLFEGAGQGCSFVLRKSIFLEFANFLRGNKGDLATVHYHDWLLYAFVRMNELGWFFDSTPMLRYRQHAFNDTGARGSVSGVLGRFEKIKNGWYSAQIESLLNIFIKAEKFRDRSLVVRQKLESGRGNFLKKMLNAFWILRNGRRRILDRGVLAVSIILGWI